MTQPLHREEALRALDPGGWVKPAVEEQGPRRYVDALRAGWWLVLLSVALATGATAFVLSRVDKVYEAEADLLVTPLPAAATTTPGLGLLRATNDPTRDVETAARFVEGADVARRVRAALRLNRSPTDLLDDVEAEPVAQSNIVSITAQATDPDLARRLADAFGNAVVAHRTELLHRQLDRLIPRLRERVSRLTPAERAAEESIARDLRQLQVLRESPDPTIRLNSRAELPTSPSSPRRALSLAGGVFVGLILGIGGAFGLLLVDPRVRREEQLRDSYRLPILARISKEKRSKRTPLTPDDLSPRALESFRMLRAAVATSASEVSPRAGSVLVTGPSGGEGKTTTAINLAYALATAGNLVILIDADVMRPTIGASLGIAPEHGLERVVTGEVELADALVDAGEEGRDLKVLLPERAGEPIPDALSWQMADRVLKEGKRLADWVVVDTPPLNQAVDMLPMAKYVDHLLVVVRLNRSRFGHLRHLAELFMQHELTPSGFVVTGSSVDNTYYGAALTQRGVPARRAGG